MDAMTPRAPSKLREWVFARCCDCRAAHQTKLSCQSTACWKTRDEILAILDEREGLLIKSELDNESLKMGWATIDKLKAELGFKENAKREVERQLEDCWIERKKAEAQLEKVKADFSEALKIGYDQQADLEKFRPLIEAALWPTDKSLDDEFKHLQELIKERTEITGQPGSFEDSVCILRAALKLREGEK